MTPEQQRIAIAEARGYSFKDEGWRYPDLPEWQQYRAVYTDNGRSFIGLAKPDWMQVPDYLNNRDEILKVIEGLTDDEQHCVNEWLCEIIEGDRYIWQATAAELCKATLMALDLWTDDAEPGA